MSNVDDKIDKIIAKYRMGFVVGDKDITTHYMDFKKELGEIVAEYYHRWVKYGYYGNGEDLDDDTEFNQPSYNS